MLRGKRPVGVHRLGQISHELSHEPWRSAAMNPARTSGIEGPDGSGGLERDRALRIGEAAERRAHILA
jgi:hypothetical protein